MKKRLTEGGNLNKTFLHRFFSALPRYFNPLFHYFREKITHNCRSVFLHIARDVSVGIQREAGVGVSENARQRFRVHPAGKRMRRERDSPACGGNVTQ